METALTSFSNELSKLVQQASSSVVAVHARRRSPSSGVHWGPDLVVTADHTISREEEIRVALPDGRSVDASLLGRAPGADIAALKVLALARRPSPALRMKPRPFSASSPWSSDARPTAGQTPASESSAPSLDLGALGAEAALTATFDSTPLSIQTPPAALSSTHAAQSWESPLRLSPASPVWPYLFRM